MVIYLEKRKSTFLYYPTKYYAYLYVSVYLETKMYHLLFYNFISLFLFIGCAGSLLLSGLSSSCSKWDTLHCSEAFSLQWLLLLWSTSSRHTGFSSCGSQALLHMLNTCGARVYLLHSMWDLPRPGVKPVSPALASGFFTTEPQGKLQNHTSLSSISLKV